MTSVRGMGQIRSMRSIRGFRSCASATALPAPRADKARITLAEAQRLWSEERRLWLEAQVLEAQEDSYC